MVTQDTSETSVTLTVATQKGVDMAFTDQDLTLSLDDFSKRILDPAMSVLAANIEADALSMYKDVYQQAAQSTITAALSLTTLLNGRKKMIDALTPQTGDWTALLCPQNNVDLVDALKALFHDSTAIKKQYTEGMMGRTAGYDFYENTMLVKHTTGSDASTYTVNGANQTGSTITVATGAATLKKGDIVTFVGCNRVHPETKADTGILQQFVVTADQIGGTTQLPISPAIVTSGATQNVAASPTTGQAIVKVGGASVTHDLSLLFHPDAFTFVTADLELPKGTHFAARETQDGISMRIVSDFDIINGKFLTRMDVLYGYLTMRPQLACRLASNASA